MNHHPKRVRRIIAMAAAALAAFISVGRGGQIQLDGRTFTLPDGFTIQRVTDPQVIQRPIVADFDEQGRLYVDDSSGSGENVQKQLAEKPHRVVRLEDTRGDGHFDKATVFADHMMFPEGAMWYAGSLYVGAPPSIWKLTDTKGNGVADRRSEWFAGKTLTGCANDIHGPYLGLDGWIYWCKGAFAEQTYERPGHKPFVTRAAHIFRCRPQGGAIEPVMTGGMDNPVHVVFMPGGERLFTTTFLHNPEAGLRDGIIHAIYGGIYGKVHDVTDDHPHTSPDVMPVLVNTGPAAECGLVRYESEVFGPEYRNNLFASSFNLHKVTRHVLSDDGSTFASKNEDFLVCDSLDFHPTDVIEDADGSLLVIDTGGWYKLCCPTSQLGKPDVLGAIYRIRKTGAPPVNDPRGLALHWAGMAPDALSNLLDDKRPAVRKRAIQALADKGREALPALEQALKPERSAQSRLAAVWAATRIDAPRARALVRAALHDNGETVRQAAAHSASVRRDKDAFSELLALLSGGTPFNRRVAAEALGRIGNPQAIPVLFQQIAKPNDRVLDHSLTYALIEIDDPKSTAAGLKDASPRVRRSAMIALDQMENGGVDGRAVAEALLSEDAALRDTAAWIAARHPEWGDVLAGALRQRMQSTQLAEAERSTLQRQLANLARSPVIQQLLAENVSDPHASADERRLALGAMGESGLKPAPAAWVQSISGVLSGSDSAVLPDAVAALRKLPIKDNQQLSRELLRVGSRSDLAPAVRLEALAAVPGGIHDVSPELFAFLTSQISPSHPAAQQLLAAQVIEHARLTPGQLSQLTQTVQTAGPLEIGPLLNAYQQTSDPEIGAKLASFLQSAGALTSLRADIVQSLLARFGPAVQKQSEPLVAKLNPDAAQQKKRLEQLLGSLPSGDVRRGQLLFNSPKAACATCHQIGYVGGNVGPDLTRVGAIRSDRDLLESVIYPSASFVQSFEPVMVVTHSGNNQYGILRRNDAQEVMLVTGPNQEAHIPRTEVKEIRPGKLSLMPAGLGEQLPPQDLADLLAFLKACK